MSINIPSNVTQIGYKAFYNTAIVNNQTNTVKYVGNWAVQCDENAASATIKSGTVGVAEYAFAYCKSMTNVTIPDGLKYLSDYAFYRDEALTSVKIPGSVKSTTCDICTY